MAIRRAPRPGPLRTAQRLLAALARLDEALGRIKVPGLARPAMELRIRISRIAAKLAGARRPRQLPALLRQVEQQVTDLPRLVQTTSDPRSQAARRRLAPMWTVDRALRNCERALGIRPGVTRRGFTGSAGSVKLPRSRVRTRRPKSIEDLGISPSRGAELVGDARGFPGEPLFSPARVRQRLKERAPPGAKRARGKATKPMIRGKRSALKKSPKRAIVRARKKVIRAAERPPRYANVELFDVGAGRLEQARSLTFLQRIRLQIDIGPLSDSSQVTRARPIPDRNLPRDIDLDVMVSSTDFLLENANANVAHGRFFLPGDGSPAITAGQGRCLNFLLTAPAQPGAAHCRIGYYFRNVLVQSQQLSANVGRPGGFQITTDFTITRDLSDFGNIPETRRVSVLTNSNNDGIHQIVFRAEASKAEPPKGDTFTIKEEALEMILRKFRAMLSERAPTTKQRSRADLERDLRKLAPLGWQLYSQLPGQRPYVFGALFNSPGDLVVQVLRPTSSSFSVPWALMYEIPLLSEPFTLCPLVSQWQESGPLAAESMRTCPHGPHAENVLCPFGFWGFRYAIEQLASSDTPVLQIRVPADSDIVVAQTQVGVDLKALAAHVQTMRTVAARLLPAAHLREGKDKNTIRGLLGHDLPFVYFYCHGKSANANDPNTWLVVGKSEIMTAAEFIGWIVAWGQKKLRVWDAVRPLVFVNACHSLAIYPTTLMSYVDAFVGSARAAGVIGTETRVSQTLAAKVAERFFELFLSGAHSVESALRAVRFEYLAAGNMLGLVYTPYCWGDLKIVAA